MERNAAKLFGSRALCSAVKFSRRLVRKRAATVKERTQCCGGSTTLERSSAKLFGSRALACAEVFTQTREQAEPEVQ